MQTLFLLLLSLISSSAFAEQLPNDTGLAPPAGDLSVSYLGAIFGVVDGVLHGAGSQLLGTMFGVFNSIILTMSMVILSYVFIISTINTAHEGEMLGKKWSSIWIPMRISIGIGLLLPKATGYSFIQVLLLWIVVQGVGAADKVWSATLDYLKRGGLIITSNSQTFSPTNPNSLMFSLNSSLIPDVIGKVFKSQICMFALQNTLNKQYQNTNIQVPDFANNLNVVPKDASAGTPPPTNFYANNNSGGKVYFPSYMSNYPNFNSYAGVCGSVSWPFIEKDKNNKDLISNVANLSAYDSASVAVQQIILDLQPMARNIAKNITDPTQPITNLLTPSQLLYTFADYMNIISPAIRQNSIDVNDKTYKFIEEAKSIGWILAGSYYFNLVKLNTKARGQIILVTPELRPTVSNSFDNNKLSQIQSGLGDKVNSAFANNSSINNYINQETAAVVGSQKSSLFPSIASDNSTKDVGTLGSLNLLGIVNSTMKDLQSELYNIEQTTKDPILQVAQIGGALIYWVESTWITITVIFVALSTAAGVAAALPFGWGTIGVAAAVILNFVSSWIMPILGAVMVPTFVTGSIMQYYLPMIPFMLFLFGALGWFAAVMEAVLAAPLVALGFTHPEGHDFLGKAEQSVMLIASVFLRPMLMIFGFIGGIILSYVGIWLLNQGFGLAWSFTNGSEDIQLSSAKDIMGIAYMVATFSIYMSIVLAIANRSFALIHELPDTILRWIGGPQEQKGAAHALEEVKGRFKEDMGTAGSYGKGLTEGGVSAGQAAGKGAGQIRKALKQDEADKKERAIKGATPSAGGG